MGRLPLRNLNSGGWIELADIHIDLQSDDDTVPEDSPGRQWGKHMIEAARIFGAPADSCTRYKDQLEEAGFVDIVVKVYKWPTNSWPRHPRFKELGKPSPIHHRRGGVELTILT